MQKRKYILGDLSDAERAQIDDLLLQDDSAYEEMLAEEDELIDAYVRRELTGKELAAFETSVRRSTRLRERLELAHVMYAGMPRPVAAPQKARVAAPVWYALAATIAIVSLVGAWALTRTHTSPMNGSSLEVMKKKPADTVVHEAAPAAQAASEQASAAPNGGPAVPSVRKTSPIVPVSIVTFVLSGATTRGESETLRFAVPAEAREVALAVSLEGETARMFNAVLRDVRGREVWSQHDRPMSQLQSGQGIEVRVPARKLEPGRYELGVYDALSGDQEPVTFIEFEIVRK